MKVLPLFLLNVAIVLIAIVAYDLVRDADDPRPKPPDPSAALKAAIEDLEARMTAIESAKPPPLTSETRLLDRLEDLEHRIGEVSTDAGPSPAATPTDETAEVDPVPVPGEEPSPEAIESFRKLAAAARQEERVRRNTRRVEGTLERLDISLTDGQREQLVEAYAAFDRRRNEIWTEVKRSGVEAGSATNWDLLIDETNQVIVREFTDRISGFISGSDASRISEELNINAK